MTKKVAKKNIPIDQIRCVWGILCSLSSSDQERNNISLFNVIEQFNIPKDFFTQQAKLNQPLAVPVHYEIVLFWKRILDIGFSDEEILTDIKIKTVDPSGKVIQEALSPIQFPRGVKRLRFRVGMHGLLLTSIGDYVHQIEVRSVDSDIFKKVVEIPFEITSI